MQAHFFPNFSNYIDSVATVSLDIRLYRLLIDFFAMPSFFAFRGVI